MPFVLFWVFCVFIFSFLLCLCAHLFCVFNKSPNLRCGLVSNKPIDIPCCWLSCEFSILFARAIFFNSLFPGVTLFSNLLLCFVCLYPKSIRLLNQCIDLTDFLPEFLLPFSLDFGHLNTF